MPASPIRKLVPYSEQAKSEGVQHRPQACAAARRACGAADSEGTEGDYCRGRPEGDFR